MRRTPRGVTLLELMIALLTQTILLAILYFFGPDIWHGIQGTKKVRASNDAHMIAIGLWGSTEDYDGFIGENGYTGILPNDWIPFTPGSATTSATYLWVQENMAIAGSHSGRFISYMGVTAGWNGPYVSLSLNQEGIRADPWGNSWRLDADGAIRSAGEDQIIDTPDDITSGPGPIKLGPKGTLFITVVDELGRAIDGDDKLFVQVSNPTPGGVAAVQLQTATWVPAQRHFTLPDLWPGRHAVQVTGTDIGTCDGSPAAENHFVNGIGTCAGLFGHTIGYVRGGGVAAVTVRVTNVVVPET